MTGYIDLASLPEDDRIKAMAYAAKEHPGKVLALMTDAEPIEKRERYKRKLKNACPQIEIIETFDGPVDGVVTIRFHVPVNQG